ncbi:MAG: hypothetical protein KDB27_23335 [Planctomycetales bacterium]|nr:hypothetical protein [Planctomycetales bacterium]
MLTAVRSLLIVTVLAGSCGVANAQQELELVRKFPPNFDFLNPSAYETTLASLKWQDDQDQALIDVLTQELDDVQAELDNVGETIDGVSEEIGQFAVESIGTKLTSRCLEELLTVQLEIATTSQMLDATKTEAAQESDRKQIALKQELEVVKGRREQMVKLLAELELEISKSGPALEDKLGGVDLYRAKQQALTDITRRQEELALKSALHGAAEHKPGQFAELSIKLKSLEARKNAIEEFLAKVTESNRRGRALRRLGHDEEQLLARKQRLAERKREIELRRLEAQSFGRLLKDRLAEMRKKEETSQGAQDK